MRSPLTAVLQNAVGVGVLWLWVFLGIGAVYWIWIAIKLGSFFMFVVGVLGPFVFLTAPIGAYMLMFGVPSWVYSVFGSN